MQCSCLSVKYSWAHWQHHMETIDKKTDFFLYQSQSYSLCPATTPNFLCTVKWWELWALLEEPHLSQGSGQVSSALWMLECCRDPLQHCSSALQSLDISAVPERSCIYAMHFVLLAAKYMQPRPKKLLWLRKTTQLEKQQFNKNLRKLINVIIIFLSC